MDEALFTVGSLGLDQFTGKVFHLMGDLPTLKASKNRSQTETG